MRGPWTVINLLLLLSTEDSPWSACCYSLKTLNKVTGTFCLEWWIKSHVWPGCYLPTLSLTLYVNLDSILYLPSGIYSSTYPLTSTSAVYNYLCSYAYWAHGRGTVINLLLLQSTEDSPWSDKSILPWCSLSCYLPTLSLSLTFYIYESTDTKYLFLE